MSAFSEVAARPRFKQITIFKEDYAVDEARGWLRQRLSSGPAELTALLGEQHDMFALLVTFVALLELIKEEEVSFERREGRLVIIPAALADII
jgi:chromatin segregation and condensation protein Rec8/ScpA/Scc1 (kleisin family)